MRRQRLKILTVAVTFVAMALFISYIAFFLAVANSVSIFGGVFHFPECRGLVCPLGVGSRYRHDISFGRIQFYFLSWGIESK